MLSESHIHPRARAFFQQAYEHQLRGDYQTAIDLYQRSLDVQRTPEAHTFRGWALSFVGDLDAAIDECLLAIELDPDFGNPYNDIGAYLLQRNKSQDALVWLKRAKAARRYENPEFPCANLARIYEQLGRWDLAEREYRAALRHNPDYRTAQEGLARLQAHLN